MAKMSKLADAAKNVAGKVKKQAGKISAKATLRKGQNINIAKYKLKKVGKAAKMASNGTKDQVRKNPKLMKKIAAGTMIAGLGATAAIAGTAAYKAHKAKKKKKS